MSNSNFQIEIVKRVLAKGRRSFTYLGMQGLRQIEFFPPVGTQKMRVLILAPGNVPIPPLGWGAVETVVSETIPEYQRNGCSILLLNSKAVMDLWRAHRFKPDVVLVHDDLATARAKYFFARSKIIAICHYGLSAKPDLWHRSFKKVISKLDKADHIICLNPTIYQVFLEYFPLKKLVISPNGSSFSPLVSEELGEGIICVGKVEPRKKQFELFKSLSKIGVEITFVGEIADKRVQNLLESDPGLTRFFVGPWSRNELSMNLSKYKALLLSSLGEADALVLYEAQLAGLNVIVNKSSLGSQDPTLPWIHVTSDDLTSQELSMALERSYLSPLEITRHANLNYNWQKRNLVLMNLILEENRS
jgi:glycosyltransferase involved in cell wall biosynthesis